MHHHRRRMVGWTLFLIGWALGLAWAQEQQALEVPCPLEEIQLEEGKGAIVGVVMGLQDNPLQGVQLSFQLQEDTATFSVETDAMGCFSVLNIPPGTYLVTVKKEGYRTFQDTLRVEPDVLTTYRVQIPTLEEARQLRGGEDWKRAEEAFKNQRFREAAEYFRRVVEKDPTYANAYYNLGLTQGILGECEEALQNLQRALDLQFKLEGKLKLNYHLVRARCFERTERWPEAAQEYEALIQMVPNHAALYLNVGRIYVQMNDYEKAINAYRKFLRLEPRAKEAPQVRKAIKTLEEALKQQKKEP